MRVPAPALTTLAIASIVLSACGAKQDEEAASVAAEAGADVAGPGIAPAVAPGVAFTFNYAFTLPADAIGKVQREHAAACAALGPGKCRVTGMNFTKDKPDRAAASLDLLLAPDVAHSFASDGIAAVEKAKGKLDRADVNGENAGAQIRLSQQDSAGLDAEAKRIEARLDAPGLAAAERAELQRQLAELRENMRGNVQQRQGLEQSIATTPVSFTYASESLIGSEGAFGKALAASWSSAETFLGLMLVVLGVALPWAGLIALIVFVWRRLRRKAASAVPVPSEYALPSPASAPPLPRPTRGISSGGSRFWLACCGHAPPCDPVAGSCRPACAGKAGNQNPAATLACCPGQFRRA